MKSSAYVSEASCRLAHWCQIQIRNYSFDQFRLRAFRVRMFSCRQCTMCNFARLASPFCSTPYQRASLKLGCVTSKGFLVSLVNLMAKEALTFTELAGRFFFFFLNQNFISHPDPVFAVWSHIKARAITCSFTLMKSSFKHKCSLLTTPDFKCEVYYVNCISTPPTPHPYTHTSPFQPCASQLCKFRGDINISFFPPPPPNLHNRMENNVFVHFFVQAHFTMTLYDGK